MGAAQVRTVTRGGDAAALDQHAAGAVMANGRFGGVLKRIRVICQCLTEKERLLHASSVSALAG